MLRRTSTTMSVLVACGLAFSAFQSDDGQKGGCAACALDSTDGGDPGVRRPTNRGDRVGCTLNAKDGVGDFGEIDQSGTGNDKIDIDIATDSIGLSWAFEVKISVFFVKEGGGPNAKFHPGSLPGLRQFARVGQDPDDDRDGTILLGTKLMRSEIEQGRRYAISAIVGHEFGHAMQAKNRCSLHRKWAELHADYMGGYWVARRYFDPVQAPSQAYASICRMGDYDFNSVGHHGTPEERGDAFEAGCRYGVSIEKANPKRSMDRDDAANAYRAGLKFIEEIRSRGHAADDPR